jgi:hypothetical protein
MTIPVDHIYTICCTSRERVSITPEAGTAYEVIELTNQMGLLTYQLYTDFEGNNFDSNMIYTFYKILRT